MGGDERLLVGFPAERHVGGEKTGIVGLDITEQFVEFGSESLAVEGGIVVVEHLLFVLGKRLDNLGLAVLIGFEFRALLVEGVVLSLQDCPLHEVEGDDMPHISVEYLLLLAVDFLHYLAFVDLTDCFGALGLDSLYVDGCRLPVVVENLIGSVRVDERTLTVEAAEDIVGYVVFLLVGIDSHHAVDQRRGELAVESVKALAEPPAECIHARVVADGSLYIVGQEVGVRLSSIAEESLPQSGHSRPVVAEGIDFSFRNTAEHRGADVPLLVVLGVVDIPWDIEVVAVVTDLVDADKAAESRHHGGACLHDIGNALYVAGTELVLLALLDESFRRVDEEDIAAVAFLLQHHDKGRYARAEEDVRRQTDDGLYIVALDEVAADFALAVVHLSVLVDGCIATEEHAVRQHDGHYAVGLEVVELMKEEGEVRL